MYSFFPYNNEVYYSHNLWRNQLPDVETYYAKKVNFTLIEVEEIFNKSWKTHTKK